MAQGEQGVLASASALRRVWEGGAHRDDYELFWSRENWQPLCAACHGRKTATKDGGYGRKGVRG